MPPSEPFELQLQRERVARTQVEALLESTRLQLIEMEMALRKAREDAVRCISDSSAKPAETVAKSQPGAKRHPAVKPAEASQKPAESSQAPADTTQKRAELSPPPLPRQAKASDTPMVSTMVSPPQDSFASASPSAAAASPATSSMASPSSKPLGTPKPRVRRAAPKPAATSLIEAARAAEAIEKAARADAEAAAVPAPMTGGMMSGMTPARAADPLISTLDLHEGDNRAIVTDFIQHLQTRIGKMQACYGSANFIELKWHVTWVRENAAAAGFAVLTLPATDLEMAIDTDAKDQIPACMDHVINQAERVAVEKVRR